MPPKKGRGRGRASKGKGYGYSSWNDGGSWDGWGDYDGYYSYGGGGKDKGWNRGARPAWLKGGNGETRDQFVDRLMALWEDSSSHAWSENEERANLVVSKVRSDLGIEDESSSQSYDEGGVDYEDLEEDHDIVSKSRKLEKRRLHVHYKHGMVKMTR